MNNSKVTSIEFVFENCNCVNVSIEDIVNFDLREITKTVRSYNNGEVGTYDVCHNAYIVFKYSAFKTKTFFELNQGEDVFSSFLYHIEKLNDITQIEIHYEDGHKELFFTDWNRYNDFQNANQKAEYGEGGIVVTINKKNAKKKKKI